eukprot:5535110-Alexandrium_andersonii.AAC.1
MNLESVRCRRAECPGSAVWRHEPLDEDLQLRRTLGVLGRTWSCAWGTAAQTGKGTRGRNKNKDRDTLADSQ